MNTSQTAQSLELHEVNISCLFILKGKPGCLTDLLLAACIFVNVQALRPGTNNKTPIQKVVSDTQQTKKVVSESTSKGRKIQ